MKIPDTSKMSRKQVAELFGTPPNSVTYWVNRDGCPSNPDKTLDLQAVLIWRVQRGATRAGKSTGQSAGLGEEKTRLTAAQADAAELNLKIALGAVVRLEDVRSAMADMAVVVRSRVMAIGQAVAPVLARLSDANEIKEELDDRHREALEELAQETPGVGESDGAMASPAPKPVGKRVGRPRKKT